AWDSALKQGHALSHAFGAGKTMAGISGVVQLIALALPIVGILLMLVRLVQRGGSWAWGRTEGKPVLRMVTVAVAGGLAVLLGLAWIPRTNYAPIHRGERGTLAEGVTAVRQLPSRHAPLVSERRAAQHNRLGPARPGSSKAGTTGSSGADSSTTDGSTAGDTGQTGTADTPTTSISPSTTVASRSAGFTGSGSTASTTSTTSRSTTTTSEPATTTTTAPDTTATSTP
ncbi:MAG: putative peptide zinc metalloprotease protein, partial [Acidimicrobiaceae bacterium]|nr:putative peptide zinc metalloprotease protein [Acidimicrobiaceae bacterium]